MLYSTQLDSTGLDVTLFDLDLMALKINYNIHLMKVILSVDPALCKDVSVNQSASQSVY